jgi:uncharacterized DUF497 family protein
MLFEWSEQKRLENLDKHGIDFLDAKEIWQGEVLEVPSAQQEHGKQRHIAYGVLEGRIRHERQDYQDVFGTGR